MTVKKMTLCIDDGNNQTTYEMYSCDLVMGVDKKISFTGELINSTSQNRKLWKDLIKEV